MVTLDKATRRRVNRAIDKLIKQDGDRCSLCHADFSHLAPTYYGTTSDGAAAIVGKCCQAKLHRLHSFGIYIVRH